MNNTNMIKVFYIFLLPAIFLIFLALNRTTSYNVYAQGQGDFSELILELNERVNTQVGFSFSITMVNPMNESVAGINIGGENSYFIGVVGSDYLCVTPDTDGVNGTLCIPFSNI